MISTEVCITLSCQRDFKVHVEIPSVAGIAAAALGTKSWVQVDEHDLEPLRDLVTELLDCVCGHQRVAQYCCVHVHVHSYSGAV